MKCLIKPAVRSISECMRHGVLLVASAVPLLAAQPALAAADTVSDFPTTARVEYVLECMKNHEGKYEYMYKCSCAIDQMAKQLKYDDFVEMSTASRHQSLGGERGAEFRDPEAVKAMAKRFKKIETESADACFIK